MRLVAVWIEKYMSIDNLGFNLGDEIFFDFKFNIQSRTLNIEVEKTCDYYNLFENSKIKNITGVLGNNGAGKTNFLKFLNVCDAKKPIGSCAVFIFKNESDEKYLIYDYTTDVFKKSKIKIVTNLKDRIFEKLYELPVTITDNPFAKVDILFYSNLYSDHNDSYLKSSNELNRSVDYLTQKSLNKDAIDEYNVSFEKNPKDSLIGFRYNVLSLYFNDRFKRLLTFLSMIQMDHKELKDIINTIPFPEYLTLNFRQDLFEDVNDLIRRSIYDFHKINEIIKFSLKYFDTEVDVSKRFKNELIFKLFLYAFRWDLFQQNNPQIPLKKLERFINSLTIDEKIFDKIYKFIVSNPNENNYYQMYKLTTIFRNLENKHYGIQVAEDRVFNVYSYKIAVNIEAWTFIKDINELFAVDPDPLISFRWHSLSAGQEAILNQFMELWEGLKHVTKNNVLVSIDEGELYLHPEWQRQYINLLYKFLNYAVNIYEDIKNVQILLTSHSPFIASDIPKQNLIFLRKDQATDEIPRPKTTLANSQIHEPTFGGNIFELFKNSFFVDNFIGAFSTRWIEEAFKKVNGNHSIFKNDQDAYDFSKLIGESVLRDVIENNLDINKDEDYEIVDLNEIAKKKLNIKAIKKVVTSKSQNIKKSKRK